MALPAFLIPILMQFAQQAMSKGLESKPAEGQPTTPASPPVQTGVEKTSSITPMQMGLLRGLGLGQ